MREGLNKLSWLIHSALGRNDNIVSGGREKFLLMKLMNLNI